MSISQNENVIRFNGKVYIVDGNNKLTLINKNIDKITELQGLKNLTCLKSLNLSRNNISTIEGLEALQRLEDLDLRSNNIARIGGLSGLSALKRLDLNYNHIKMIREVDQLTQTSQHLFLLLRHYIRGFIINVFK